MNLRLPAAIFALCAGSIAADGPERSVRKDHPSGRDGRDHRGPDGIDHFIRKADTDGDGAVSREEFEVLERIARLPEGKRRELFDRLDKDGDGMIRPEELHKSRRRGGAPPPFPSLEELDLDGNGEVTFEEFLANAFVRRMPETRRRAFFDRLDRDGDGVLTADDRREWGRGEKDRSDLDRERLFSKMDRDRDGVVDREEFFAAPWHRGVAKDELGRRFDALDRDGDGAITRREFSDFDVPTRGRADDRGARGKPSELER